MKSVLFFMGFLLILSYNSTISGETYIWTDEKGQKHFSNKPPPDKPLSEIEIRKSDYKPDISPPTIIPREKPASYYKRLYKSTRKSKSTSCSVSSGYSNANFIINRYCKARWPNDYQMQKYCIDTQKTALKKLKRGCPGGIPSGIFVKIRNKCSSEWPEDYQMRAYCEKTQFTAWRSLQK